LDLCVNLDYHGWYLGSERRDRQEGPVPIGPALAEAKRRVSEAGGGFVRVYGSYGVLCQTMRVAKAPPVKHPRCRLSPLAV
jgi:hypothetical protein